jgi:hypothetical protein
VVKNVFSARYGQNILKYNVESFAMTLNNVVVDDDNDGDDDDDDDDTNE